MKIKLEYLFILIFVPFLLHAQKDPNPIHFYFQGGVNYDLNYTHESINAEHKHYAGWSLGLGVEKMIAEKWSLNLELNVVQSRGDVNNYSEYDLYRSINLVDTLSTRVGDIAYNKRFFQIAFLFRKYMLQSQKLFFEFGFDIKSPQINNGSWDYTSTKYYNSSYGEEPQKLPFPIVEEIRTYYNPPGGYIGGNLGVGMNFKLFKKTQAHFKFRMSQQLKEAAPFGGIVFRNVETIVGVRI